MKKTTILNLIVAISFIFGANAQQTVYFQDDFTNDLAKWSSVDRDGDGKNWFITDFSPAQQGKVALSASYDVNTKSALTPDNWLISDSIDLSSATGITHLSWVVKAQSQNYPDEEYYVYVGTSNNIDTLINDGEVFTEIVGATNDLYSYRSVDISSFNGEQKIYVAFRHYGSTDEFYLNIDDVSVFEPSTNDLAVMGTSVNSELIGFITFTTSIINVGLSPITSFDFELNVDGVVKTKNPTSLNILPGEEYLIAIQVDVNDAKTVPVTATITSADDVATNNSYSSSFEFFPIVTQYIGTDTKGNAFNLYDQLKKGQAVILDFMASWCGPCKQSTPELAELVENNGAGQGNLQALAISVEETDTDSKLNGLNWYGGHYEYPKFAYTITNNNNFYHYAIRHGFNTGSIPFFVMICPNTTDPGKSSIVKYDIGYAPGMLSAYQTALDQCPTATLDAIELPENDFHFSAYPNPANDIVNVDFSLQNSQEVTLTLTTMLGQEISQKELGTVSGKQNASFNVAHLETGIYLISIKTENGKSVKRISVQ